MQPTGSSSAPILGVVIRTLNEAELLGTCLQVLDDQRSPFTLDVLVVDSGSTDATCDIARAHGARLVEITPESFDYSRALNQGIDAVRGDLVAILSAHAILTDEHWVATITAPFADPKVAGVCSRQIPWPDAPFHEVHRLSGDFGTERRVHRGIPPDDLLFSNAASCIRRSAWETMPFTLPAAEDLEWAQRAMRAGWTLIYEPGCSARHSHNESARAQARRLIDLNRGRAPGVRRDGWRQILREAATYLYRDGRLILSLDEPRTRKLRHLIDLVQMCGYYVVDFSRSGTTAQFRRST